MTTRDVLDRTHSNLLTLLETAPESEARTFRVAADAVLAVLEWQKARLGPRAREVEAESFLEAVGS